jgi:hypothetical protein
MSISDMRYQQVLKDLAVVANNPGILPSFALTAGGAANVTNTLSIETVTLWDQAVKGFSMETLTAFAQHNPDLQWTLNPVASAPQLEALGYACLWALKGPPPEGSRPMELLREPRITDIGACGPKGKPIYHLDVASQLAALPPGWVRVAPKHLAPKNAHYKATCGNTTIWVPDENLAWLSEFTLILLDIATIDPTSLVLPSPKVSVDISPAPNAPDKPIAGLMSFENRRLYKNEKITELWDACQDPNDGSIKLSRPKIYSYPRLAMPVVGEEDFQVQTPPIKPQFTIPFSTTIR